MNRPRPPFGSGRLAFVCALSFVLALAPIAGDAASGVDAGRRLGDRFELAGFHDAVLGDGALLLSVLDARIDRWIASRTSTAMP